MKILRIIEQLIQSKFVSIMRNASHMKKYGRDFKIDNSSLCILLKRIFFKIFIGSFNLKTIVAKKYSRLLSLKHFQIFLNSHF